MSEPQKQQIGDGQDSFGNAAGNAAKAAQQAGKEAAKQAAQKGAEATAKAAAGVVKAGVESGKAVSEIAASTAAGGPWGAAIAALWSMRHTLFKILVCICLAVVFLVVMVVSLPSIIFDSIFGTNGTQPAEGTTVTAVYSEMSDAVSDAVDLGYQMALDEVDRIITDGGYDRETSMNALINYAQSSAGYDACYILAAYSASLQQQNTSKDDMMAKLQSVAADMFAVTYEEKEEQYTVPGVYYAYEPVTVTVVTRTVQTGAINGVPQYRYETETRTYYTRGEPQETMESIEIDAYESVTVTVPVYTDGSISGTKSVSYYQKNGTETIAPTVETIKYVACTIHPFNNSVIATAFGIDLNATYGNFNITYGEAIQNMATALKATIYGATASGSAVPLTDAELIAFLNRQNCNATRKRLLETGLSLVGKVPYFWGGKSAAGWNEEWNTPKLVTAAGSPSSGTIRPYGLDCSGFTDWVYKTALGVSLQAGTGGQWENSYSITADELLPGDLGFLMESDGSGWNHVLMFAGYSEDGARMWVHSSSGTGVILNTPSYEGSLQLRRPSKIDFDALVTSSTPTGEALYTIEVDVTHYCACEKCCGSNADGITASGKQAARGMVAMSSYYPFGTQIMINGTLYTVEDRGGSGIENDIHRVDIFVPDHNEALRLGRYTTTATIYRLGR